MAPVLTALLLAGAARPAAAVRVAGPPSALKVLPFSKVADEIHEAEMAAEELKWKVGNSTEEKASLQWFMATAMKELTNIQKVVMNASIDGTLGNKYERCVNSTTAKFPTWNQSLTFGQAVKKDDNLAPTMVEARMYELYELEQKSRDLTMELGECTAKCPSFLSKRSRVDGKKVTEDPAPAPAGGAAPAKLSPRELMKSVANAIYNTSASIDQMNAHLKKDQSAKTVLQNLSSLIMAKLLAVKKAVAEMKEELETCLHAPLATRLNDEVSAAMGENPDVALDLVSAAADSTKATKAEVDAIQEKLDACKKKCR